MGEQGRADEGDDMIGTRYKVMMLGVRGKTVADGE